MDYRVRAEVRKTNQVKVTVEDAGRAMLTANFAFCQAPARDPAGDEAEIVPASVPALQAEPARLGTLDLQEGVTVDGEYAPAAGPFRDLVVRLGLRATAETAPRLAAFLWASYVVGMKLPGERALFSQLSIRFRESCPPLTLPFAYRARVVGLDQRFDLLEVSAELACGGLAIADVNLSSFVRADSPAVRFPALTACLPPSGALRGRLALVIGGSRGLGAALVAALASQGCEVFLNYRSSRGEAEGARFGRARCGWGRHTGTRRCLGPLLVSCVARAARERGGLDILLCNAIPPIRILGFALDSMSRFRKYVDDSLALVSTPLAAFLDLLESRAGRAVIISSAFASDVIGASPPDLHHYSAAKAAVEGVVRSLAGHSKRAHFLVARPPPSADRSDKYTYGPPRCAARRRRCRRDRQAARRSRRWASASSSLMNSGPSRHPTFCRLDRHRPRSPSGWSRGLGRLPQAGMRGECGRTREPHQHIVILTARCETLCGVCSGTSSLRVWQFFRAWSSRDASRS